MEPPWGYRAQGTGHKGSMGCEPLRGYGGREGGEGGDESIESSLLGGGRGVCGDHQRRGERPEKVGGLLPVGFDVRHSAARLQATICREHVRRCALRGANGPSRVVGERIERHTPDGACRLRAEGLCSGFEIR